MDKLLASLPISLFACLRFLLTLFLPKIHYKV